MTRLLAALLTLACSLITVPALAECVTIERARLDSDCVVMPYGEQRGVWFRLDKAEALRKAHLELPELREQVASYERLIQVRDSQVSDFRAAAVERKASVKALLDTNERLVTDARTAREERDKAVEEMGRWYRSPFLWFGAGMVATLATGATVVILTR